MAVAGVTAARARSSRAGLLCVVLAIWSFLIEPVYGLVTDGAPAFPIGEAVIFTPVMLVLAFLAFRGGAGNLRIVSIVAWLLALAQIPAGIFATRDPTLWWSFDPSCGIVWCGALHTLAHWSHVPFLVAIALVARRDAAI